TRDSDRSRDVPLVRGEQRAERPLSYAQERLWFLQQLAPESPYYNVPMALRLHGALDAGAMERALCEIVRRHEAMRTRFVGVGEGELSARYEAYAEGRESPLPELAIQYADYAEWQRTWLSGEELERQLGYWRERLGDLPPLELPADRVRPAVQTHRGETLHTQLEPDLTRKLKELSRREGVTLFMTLLAV